MQEMCRCSTDLAIPSNIKLENKIGNPRPIRERYQKQTKNLIDRCGIGFGLKDITFAMTGDQGFSQIDILFFLFYIYTIISSKSETATRKKTVAKHKRKPSHTLHGRKTGKNGFTQKQFEKNIKADSQIKSLELGFLFKLLKIEEIYLIRIRILSYHNYLGSYKSRRKKLSTTSS
jgi:hypothetical protein